MKALQEETVAAKDRVSELNAEIAREKGDTAAADALDLQLEKQQNWRKSRTAWLKRGRKQPGTDCALRNPEKPFAGVV